MENYSKQLELLLKRKNWVYRNLTFIFDSVEFDESTGSYEFNVTVKPNEDDSFIHTQVLDKIEQVILRGMDFFSQGDGEVPYSIFADYNGEENLRYGQVYLSEQDKNEIMGIYNYYMRALRNLGFFMGKSKVVVLNPVLGEVSFRFIPNIVELPENKRISDIPLSGIQNAVYEKIDELLSEKFTDDDEQGVTFDVRITPNA